MLVQTKSLVSSKTFWLALAQACVAIVVVFQTSYPDAGVLLMLKSVLDIVIRLYTTQPISKNL